MAVSDEALLAGMAAGDPQSAAGFVRRHQARVYGLALSIVGVAATAEDVAQEAFLRAWRFAGGYDPRRGAVLGWLLTITRNAALDVVRLRRDQPYQPDILIAMLSAADPGDTTPDDQLVEGDHIRTVLRRLPVEQATAVVLATFYGLTAKEIATREKVPLGTAKSRIRLGLLRLREYLEVTEDG